MSFGESVPLDRVAAVHGVRLESLARSGGAGDSSWWDLIKTVTTGAVVSRGVVSGVLGSVAGSLTKAGASEASRARPQDSSQADRAALIDLGWLGNGGEVTAARRRLRKDLGATPVTWTLSAADPAGERRARVLVGVTQAVVIEEATRRPWHVRDHPADDRVHVGLVSRSALPLVLAAWVGLGPAWSVDTDVAVPADLVEARLRSAEVPAPRGADAALCAIWSNPWVLWSVSCPNWRGAEAHLSAGDRGQFLVRPIGDGRTVRLVAQPATLIWGRLLEVCHPPEIIADDWGR
ncbi:MAG TPA: hypothetical protein VES01_10265 [Dermatophilaceae bacterium]|nr:hypothetical protein [Dermatophilaceae bacterium]